MATPTFVESLLSGDSAPIDTAVQSAPAETQATESIEATPDTSTNTQDQAAATSPESPVEVNADPEFTALLEKLAGDLNLNLQDESERSIAERVAKREQASLQAGQQKPVDTLTEFERQQYGTPAEKPAQAAQPEQVADTRQPQAIPQGPPKYGDIGDGWKSPADAYQAQMGAWAKVQDAIDKGVAMSPELLGEVRQIDDAMFVRRVDSMVMPYLAKQIPEIAERVAQQRLESLLGDMLPEVRQQIDERRQVGAREAALADLEKIPTFAGVRELYKEEPGEFIFKDPATGQELKGKNTPLNRIISQHPEILNVDITHDPSGKPLPPAVAERLTMTARLKLAHGYLQAQRPNPATAKTFLDAGKKVAERQQSDRFRQQLNSGSGATTRGASSEPAGFVDGLLNSAGGGSSFSSLFKP